MSKAVSTPRPVTFAEMVLREKPNVREVDFLKRQNSFLLKISMNCFLQNWTTDDVQTFITHFLLDLSLGQLYNVYTTINRFQLKHNYEHHLINDEITIEGKCTICLLDVINGIVYCLLLPQHKMAFLKVISNMPRIPICQYWPSDTDMDDIEYFITGDGIPPVSAKFAPLILYFSNINIIGLEKLSYSTLFVRNLIKQLFDMLPFNMVAFDNNKYDITVNESCKLTIQKNEKFISDNSH